MFHAASMGAHSWAENLEPVINHYNIYAFDNPGEGNRSELNYSVTFCYFGRVAGITQALRSLLKAFI